MAWFTIGELQTMLDKFDKNLPVGAHPDGYDCPIEIWGVEQRTDEDGVDYVAIDTE